MKYSNLFIFLAACFSIFGQTETPRKEKFPSYFGLQVRPVFPTNFIGSPITEMSNDLYSTSLTQKMGYSFGGTVRAGVTKLIAIETGINFTQRNFDIAISVPDSNIFGRNTLSFIQYDIPINALIYVQLSEKFYMNASMGGTAVYNPTNVGVLTTPGSLFSFRHTGASKKFGFDLNANFGFEYRTEKIGFFYIGGSARIPLAPVFTLISEYTYQGTNNSSILSAPVDGSFLALDFKYFFPNIRNKGVQFQRGPIL